MKKIKHLKLIIIIILLIVLIPQIPTFGKFIMEKYNDFYLDSKHFYFNSNRLKETTPLYEVNNWSGVGTFDITFSLTSSKNNYLFTDYDISYNITYTCDSNVNCSANKTTGIIYSTSHQDEVTLTVTPTTTFHENDSTTIHVEATSTDPYVKTISADFKYIVGKEGITYETKDTEGQAYLLFTITNASTYCNVIEAFDTYSVGDDIDVSVYNKLTSANKLKCVSQYATLEFNPSTILLDTTESLLKKSTTESTTINNISYVNKITIPLEPMSSTEIRFYKLYPTNNYTTSNIITFTSYEP